MRIFDLFQQIGPARSDDDLWVGFVKAESEEAAIEAALAEYPGRCIVGLYAEEPTSGN